jgi:hypothetical protein
MIGNGLKHLEKPGGVSYEAIQGGEGMEAKKSPRPGRTG